MSSMGGHLFGSSSRTKASSLPVSVGLGSEEGGRGLRRRLSSLKIPNIPKSSSSSPSMTMSDYTNGTCITIKKWWDCVCAWILSSKPIFVTDLEMNQQYETKLLRGTWEHLFTKLRSQITRLITSDHHHLPQTYNVNNKN
ncbi:hypothetical protein Lal_00013624 [Lupinus albus]|uniref:Uncharacterized protein n=1 Tax=Lupinus albus TaxID=3870 RepID=A0A6A5NZG6_LUPAL|nr:hypothetical protein Lalb_Chr10g0107691 [Lupinus albus]KAF1890370.1 hypothetical protein Lal_00013624 [Lupinus albus]